MEEKTIENVLNRIKTLENRVLALECQQEAYKPGFVGKNVPTKIQSFKIPEKHEPPQQNKKDTTEELKKIENFSIVKMALKKANEEMNEYLTFDSWAKMYRFDRDNKTWKERGEGNIRILQDKEHTSHVRVLMRREKVLTLACNHRITPDMTIEFYMGNTKVVRWSAVDHSEEETKPELFTCRFGTEDKCLEFKTKMEEMIAFVASSSSPHSSLIRAKDSTDLKTKDGNATGTSKPLSELFKKAEGSWNCVICNLNNSSGMIKCVACKTPKHGCESGVAKQKDELPKPQKRSQVLASSLTSCYTIPSASEDSILKKNSEKIEVKRGLIATPGFRDLVKSRVRMAMVSKPADFKGFGEEGSLGTTGTAPPRNRSTSQGSEGGDGDDFVPTAEFAPVVPLPPLVETKLGDENENVIFDSRAKVYRFDRDNKTWKERGVGNIRILQDKEHTSHVRVLMWREKVLKLACNHRLTPDMTIDFYMGNPKAVRWGAVDHAEEEPKPELFTCRFRNVDKCLEFKTKMEEMIAFVASSSSPHSSLIRAKDSTDLKTKDGNATGTSKPLSDLFKKAEGSWDCVICNLNNSQGMIKCVACKTPKPGCEIGVAKQKDELPKPQVPQFNFEFNQSLFYSSILNPNFNSANNIQTANPPTSLSAGEIPKPWEYFDENSFHELASLYK